MDIKEIRAKINYIKAVEGYNGLGDIAEKLDISKNTLYKATSKDPGTLNLDNLVRKLKKHYPQYFTETSKNVIKEDPTTYKRDEWSKDDIDESIADFKNAEDRLYQINESIKLLESRVVGLKAEKDHILQKFEHLR